MTTQLTAPIYRKDGDSPFRVRVSTDDGREETVDCWASDAWNARTRAVVGLVNLRLNGCLVTFDVTPLTTTPQEQA